mmetsp:Transcript_7791/g.15021  ORF Transcript_7791/g.15021 Transcript_7791/m.15021 type:complete len:200 (-) Transcript_7791:134-733(-)
MRCSLLVLAAATAYCVGSTPLLPVSRFNLWLELRPFSLELVLCPPVRSVVAVGVDEVGLPRCAEKLLVPPAIAPFPLPVVSVPLAAHDRNVERIVGDAEPQSALDDLPTASLASRLVRLGLFPLDDLQRPKNSLVLSLSSPFVSIVVSILISVVIRRFFVPGHGVRPSLLLDFLFRTQGLKGFLEVGLVPLRFAVDVEA